MLELSSWGRVRFECPNDHVGSVTKLLGLKILLKIYTWGFLHFPLPFCDTCKFFAYNRSMPLVGAFFLLFYIPFIIRKNNGSTR